MANCTFKKRKLVLGPKGNRDKKVAWMKDQTHQVRTESWFPLWQILKLERAQDSLGKFVKMQVGVQWGER